MSRYHLGFFSWKLSPSRRDIMSCHYRIRHIKKNSADISSKSAWLATLRFHAEFWDFFTISMEPIRKQGVSLAGVFFGCLRSCTISNHKAGSRKSTQQLKCNKLIMQCWETPSRVTRFLWFSILSAAILHPSNKPSKRSVLALRSCASSRTITPGPRSTGMAPLMLDERFLMQIFGTRFARIRKGTIETVESGKMDRVASGKKTQSHKVNKYMNEWMKSI